MTASAKKLREEVEIKRRELKSSEDNLRSLVNQCPHDWSEPIADHIRTPGYTVPGDPPGTMGIDWRGPTYVDSKTEYRWKRICNACGEVEYTSHTEDTVITTPKFYSK